MDQCLSEDSEIQIEAYQTLLENKVDVIIASPETKVQLERFARTNNLSLAKECDWIYSLKSD